MRTGAILPAASRLFGLGGDLGLNDPTGELVALLDRLFFDLAEGQGLVPFPERVFLLAEDPVVGFP
jgi:hypothetical protein